MTLSLKISSEYSTVKSQTSKGVFKTIISLITRSNDLLNVLRTEKQDLIKHRESGEISFKDFWRLRMDLEYKIQDAIERRDEITREMVLSFPRRK